MDTPLRFINLVPNQTKAGDWLSLTSMAWNWSITVVCSKGIGSTSSSRGRDAIVTDSQMPGLAAAALTPSKTAECPQTSASQQRVPGNARQINSNATTIHTDRKGSCAWSRFQMSGVASGSPFFSLPPLDPPFPNKKLVSGGGPSGKCFYTQRQMPILHWSLQYVQKFRLLKQKGSQ